MPRFANREEYEAWKRGEGAAPAPAAAASREPAPAAATAAPASKPKQGFKETMSGLPPWAWIFVAGCIALPVVNLGGAIPGALGFGGAAACANVAKKKEWETAPRILVCALIAGGVWVVYLGFAVAFVSLRK